MAAGFTELMLGRTGGLRSNNALFTSISNLSGCFPEINQPPTKKRQTRPLAGNLNGSIVLPVEGNVYPLGRYQVKLKIGQPSRSRIFDLDIDSGSALTWVECDPDVRQGQHCKGCIEPLERRYHPRRVNVVKCNDPLCIANRNAIRWPNASPDGQCDYEINYADGSSSLGVLVKDFFPLTFSNGIAINPILAFGCGYDQKYPPNSPSAAGVLGLGKGSGSILSQLHDQGLTRNVLGHCLSQKGGFLFFGDSPVPSPQLLWTPMSSNLGNYYSSGPATVNLGGEPTKIKDLTMVFDSGSTYTFFNSRNYKAIVNLIKKNLRGKPLISASEDPTLPVCWKPANHFVSIRNVMSYFMPLSLNFTNTDNVELHVPPHDYLVVTDTGSVCLGILNGTEAGMGDLNVIGDNFMQDKMVVYDNERQHIGWVPLNPNSNL